VTEGPLEQLLADHARPVFRLLPEPGQRDPVARLVAGLSAADWSTEVSTEPGGVIRVGVSDAAAAGAAILPLVVASGVRLATFDRARPTLEDVFLELVGPPTPDDLDGRGWIRPREVAS